MKTFNSSHLIIGKNYIYIYGFRIIVVGLGLPLFILMNNRKYITNKYNYIYIVPMQHSVTLPANLINNYQDDLKNIPGLTVAFNSQKKNVFKRALYFISIICFIAGPGWMAELAKDVAFPTCLVKNASCSGSPAQKPNNSVKDLQALQY